MPKSARSPAPRSVPYSKPYANRYRSRGALLPSCALALAAALSPGCRTTAQSTGIEAAGGLDATEPLATPLGVVTGVRTDDGEAFYGLPYAKPPVAARRWQAPEPVEPWTQPLAATHEAPKCPQGNDPLKLGPLEHSEISGAEDCLYLNLYRPTPEAGAAALPVMVWIHGGAFAHGSASAYDGGLFAKKFGVLVVALNYRVGALGFLAHPALDKPGAEAGNYGLLDTVLALRWIKQNIAAYGGDPQRVTISGQASGATAVCHLLSLPAADGLYRGAIMQSGDCSGPQAFARREVAAQNAVAFAAALGCPNDAGAEACLRRLDPAALVAKASSFTINAGDPSSGIHWGPSYSPGALPEQAAGAGRRVAKVPVLQGVTHDEARMVGGLLSIGQPKTSEEAYIRQVIAAYSSAGNASDVLGHYPAGNYATPGLASMAITTDSTRDCPAYQLSQALAQSLPASYFYEFNDRHAQVELPTTADVPDYGAFHSADVTYIFQKKWPIGDPAKFSPEQQELADRMGTYWSNFVKSGDPNKPEAEALPEWRKDGDQRFVMSLTPEEGRPPSDFAADHHCSFWQSRPLTP